ncbi:uncharacterized protein SCDLUD_001248 [Saccharomycodes ludwigii]|uniref:uncharacterized protein n=1 Tax=Saccharomycodes ludwigii TaxID=36035 RepID=UPI001E830F73|nr:hypothetical protein SCDLUD_001248 [Saccharomycodes ludwigii]KAH3903604.1 hypothetical protein SCDLUD_001248 [Saccharomycodes ludwigii]
MTNSKMKATDTKNQNTKSVIKKYNSVSDNFIIASPKTVKKIHIYDFDNTLYNSPAPNPNLLNMTLYNIINSPNHLVNSGWWSESCFLEASIDEWLSSKEKAQKNGLFSPTENGNMGEETINVETLQEDDHLQSMKAENITIINSKDQTPIDNITDSTSVHEPDTCTCVRCNVDAEYWSRNVVQLLRLSLADPETLSIIMTGRKECYFSKLFDKILSNPVFGEKIRVHGVFLKKDGFDSTLKYKTQVLHDLLERYYKNGTLKELIMYDDRINQIKSFKTYLMNAVRDSYPKLVYNVIAVPPSIKYLNICEERLLIEQILAKHNDAVLQTCKDANGNDYCRFQLCETFLGTYYLLTQNSIMDVVGFTVRKIAQDMKILDVSDYAFNPIGICIKIGGILSNKEIAKILGGKEDIVEEDLTKAYSFSSFAEKFNYTKVFKWKLEKFGIHNQTNTLVYEVSAVYDKDTKYRPTLFSSNETTPGKKILLVVGSKRKTKLKLDKDKDDLCNLSIRVKYLDQSRSFNFNPLEMQDEITDWYDVSQYNQTISTIFGHDFTLSVKKIDIESNTNGNVKTIKRVHSNNQNEDNKKI